MEFIRAGLLSLLEILINLSLQGSFCVLLVLLARFLLRKAPRWCSYVLWSAVFLRLICPVFPEGSFSLMPRQLQINREFVLEQIQEELTERTVTGSILATEDVVADKAVIGSGLSEQDDVQAGVSAGAASNGIVASGSTLSNGVSVNSEKISMEPSKDFSGATSFFASAEHTMQSNQTDQSVSDMAKLIVGFALIWLVGTLGFAVYHIVSYQLLKRRVRNADEVEEGIFELKGEHLSFVMGIVKPKIYLSEGLDAETRKVILCHERVHLQRRDYIFKPVALGICCLHWWNPLVWLAFYLMNKDCEMSCDEKVVALLGEESKTVYSYALLNEATKGDWFRNRRGSVCALLSFGEDHVKNRISHVLKYKKASIGVICCAVLLLIVLGVGLCSNPKSEEAGKDVTDTALEEQAEALKAKGEDLEALEKELEAAKQEEMLKAEQEALQEVLEQVEKEQQELESLEQELAQDKKDFSKTEEYGEIVLALERYTWAFAERDGDALFELAGDKAAFQLWDMVYPQEDGTYAFGESSPWVRDWTTLIREEDTSTATIRFIMENSIPEYYLAEEIVKLTKSEEGYYVDHVDYKLYSEINSVQELEAAYEWTNGTAVKGIRYNADYVKTILQHLTNGTNPEYYSAYLDPVSAAKLLLHLGEGLDEFHEIQIVKTVSPQNPLLSKCGEGTIAFVHYYFKDGSVAVIPMVLAEESQGIWMLAEDDEVIADAGEINTDNLQNIREVYDSCEVGDVTYQLTNMGIYQLDSNGLTFLYPAYAASTAKLAYDNGKLYFPTDSYYSPGALDWWDDSIAVLDIETLMMNYIKLPQSAYSVFPLGGLYVRDGYISMWQDGASQSYCMLLEDVLPVYNGKLATELSEDEKNAYGKEISEQVLANPNQIYRVGLHTQSTTFAYLDLDGDGKVEEVRMSKHGSGYDAPMDSFILTAGEGKLNCSAMNQVNEIYAWSPDGEQIFILLYQDGPSGDPMTTFYRYENNRLHEAGTIASDVRTAALEDGIISTVIRRDVIQTDGIKVQYQFNEAGEVELIEQETYDFVGLNDVALKEMLKLYAKPDGSQDITIMMKPQTVHITKTDKNFEWVLIEGENGTQGWIRVKNILYVGDNEVLSGEIFDGLSFAG